MPDRNPIVGAATVMAALLTDVEAAGLPLPYVASATDYEGVRMQIAPEHIPEWSVFLGVVPIPEDEPYEGRVHTHMVATEDGVQITVTALVPVDEVAA